MSGVLYIVATPIGNLDDISQRAIATLRSVDVIAAEDTRHSRSLLNHHAIGTPLLSLHQHNESARSGELLARLCDGQQVAVISDAGTPLISDPGFELVRAAAEAGVRVCPIPGPSSPVAALSAAGLPSDQFMFCGFLPARASQRKAQLEALQAVTATLLFFESSHRIQALLEQIEQLFPERQLVVAKELTKLHERFLRGRAAEVLSLFEQDPSLRKGEFVVILSGAVEAPDESISPQEVDVLKILLREVSVSTAAKIAARITGKNKNRLYSLALELQREIQS